MRLWEYAIEYKSLHTLEQPQTPSLGKQRQNILRKRLLFAGMLSHSARKQKPAGRYYRTIELVSNRTSGPAGPEILAQNINDHTLITSQKVTLRKILIAKF